MTAFFKDWVVIADAAVDPDSPVDAALMTGLRDDLMHLREWLGGSYLAGASPDHIHDGIGSAMIEVGANLLRNGSFESGETGWTLVDNTGGSHAVQTEEAMHGKHCLAITSTVLGNGGGSAISNELIGVAGGRAYCAAALFKASVPGVSSEIEIIWYNALDEQISTSPQILTATPDTDKQWLGSLKFSPPTAVSARVKIYGGVPGVGTETGTVYVDGAVFVALDFLAGAAEIGAAPIYLNPLGVGYQSGNNYTSSPVEVANMRLTQDGTYRASFKLHMWSFWALTVSACLYKNGVAVGVVHSTSNMLICTDDVTVARGDTLQVFCWTNYVGQSQGASISDFVIGAAPKSVMAHPVVAAIGER